MSTMSVKGGSGFGGGVAKAIGESGPLPIYVIFIPVYLSKKPYTHKGHRSIAFQEIEIRWSRSGSRDPDVQGHAW